MTLAPARTLGTPGIDRFTPAQLLRTARLFASDPALATLLDPGSGDRQWAELDSSAALQVWLISWPPGTDTGLARPRRRRRRLRDGARRAPGADLVRRPAAGARLTAGAGRAFGGQHVHHVANAGTLPRCQSMSTRRG